MDIDTLQGLQACPLFEGLSESDIISLMRTIRYRVRTCHRGEVFALSGDICQHANIIISGEMAATLITSAGRSLSMTMHHSGNMLAPAFLLATERRYPVCIEAISDTRILRITAADFEKLLRTDDRIALNFVRILSNVVAYLTKKMSLLAMNVRERLALYLREQQRQQLSSTVVLPHSRQQLAHLFGVQKNSLQRCLTELRNEGFIELEGKRVRILRPL